MGHWYKEDGAPCHTVKGKNGKERDATLRDARKLSLVPSVTEILKIVSAPALTNYFIKQHLEAAFDTELDVTTNYLEWTKTVKELANKHSKDARDKGAGIHAQLERWYSDKNITMYAEYVSAVDKKLFEEYGVKVRDVDTEKTFSREGFGGAVDLSNPEYIFDFKYKSSGFDDKEKLGYDQHIGQLSAYRYGLDYPKAKLVNVFIGPDHKVRCVEWSEEEASWGLDYFMACLSLWRTVKRFS